MCIQMTSKLMLAAEGTRAMGAGLKNKRNRYVSDGATENNRGAPRPKRVRLGRRDQDLPRASYLVLWKTFCVAEEKDEGMDLVNQERGYWAGS